MSEMEKFIKIETLKLIVKKISNPLIIVFGVLLSFYLDNELEKNNKIEYKNFVIKNLKMILVEDLNNIQQVKKLQK